MLSAGSLDLGEAAEQLLLGRSAEVEGPVDQATVDLEEGEEQVDRPDAGCSASGGKIAGQGHGPGRGVTRRRSGLDFRDGLGSGHQRRLAYSQPLHRCSDAAVQAHGAQPALRLVLGGACKGECRADQRGHQRGIL